MKTHTQENEVHGQADAVSLMCSCAEVHPFVGAQTSELFCS